LLPALYPNGKSDDHVGDRHGRAAIQFVDARTGKGAIPREITVTVRLRCRHNGIAPSDDLAVLVDPGDCAAIVDTGNDFLVANACLNATVCGLVSRTVVTPNSSDATTFTARSTTQRCAITIGAMVGGSTVSSSEETFRPVLRLRRIDEGHRRRTPHATRQGIQPRKREPTDDNGALPDPPRRVRRQR
jgi:Phosphoribosyl transferase (PRTase)